MRQPSDCPEALQEVFFMTAVLIGPTGAFRLIRQDLRAGEDESWIQDLVFRNPDLVPLSEIEPGSGTLIPICREFVIPRQGGAGVKLDVLAITPLGRPVLIECKLWRNPQARREVVAQILEYASLMRGWSFGDLTARIARQVSAAGQNPLYDLAHAAGTPLGEAAFCDAVSRHLRDGTSQMIVVGDGIREDLIMIAEHVGAGGTRLALLELQVWKGETGEVLVVPQIPFRTEVLQQRVLVDLGDRVIPLGDETTNGHDAEDLPELNADRVALQAASRRFWQEFIDRVKFDHPDQSPPRHGGHNWVKIPLPAPAAWLLAYRNGGEIGLSLIEKEGSNLLSILGEEAEDIGAEILPWALQNVLAKSGKPRIATVCPVSADPMFFLLDAANRMVSALRPRIAQVRKIMAEADRHPACSHPVCSLR